MNYIVVLLRDIYKWDTTVEKLIVSEDVGGQSVDWPLGAFMYHFNQNKLGLGAGGFASPSTLLGFLGFGLLGGGSWITSCFLLFWLAIGCVLCYRVCLKKKGEKYDNLQDDDML